MKITAIFITFCAFALSSFGQYNPVNNLEWEHWYVMPNNYFELSWSPPLPSQDTLIGYNIYRETELYIFQTGESLFHTEYGSNCPEDFVVYNNGSFWIHVTAVYNSTQAESDYVDSAYCYGFAIGINNIETRKINIFPNPTKGIIKIDENNIKVVLITNQSGEIILESKSNIIDLSDKPKGVYFIKIVTDNNAFVDKIIVE